MKASCKSKNKTVRIEGQNSWRLASDSVELFITETGGHMAPVTFKSGSHVFQPFSIAPWCNEKLDPSTLPLIQVLRGDFFCLPFGGNATPWNGEKHPVHGQTANDKWTFVSSEQFDDASIIHLQMKTTVRPGVVDKRIALCAGQSVVYSMHAISGMSGPMSVGHHAMLKFNDSAGSGKISSSEFVHGQVLPIPFENPENGGYSTLKPGAVFDSLDKVEKIDGTFTDLSVYPARRGFDDLVAIVNKQNSSFAWTAVTFNKDKWVWLSLKNPAILPQTVFWFSNGGRHYPPWNGRHINVLGVEETASYFHFGLAESVRNNPFAKQGFVTKITLQPEKTLIIPYIMMAVKIPVGFDYVHEVEKDPDGKHLILKSKSNKIVKAPVFLDFLQDPEKLIPIT